MLARHATKTFLVPLALIAAMAAIGLGSSRPIHSMVVLGMCNLVIVLGLQLLIGNSGIYSFGQVAFAALGAYTAALITLPAAFVSLQTPSLPSVVADMQPSPLLAALIAMAVCGVLAAGTGLALIRTSTLAIPISTFAFLIVVYNVLANWDRLTGGSAGLVGLPKTTSLAVAGSWAVAALIGTLVFKYSANGWRLRASGENEVAAASIGIRVRRERLIAFTMSGMVCGLGGALSVHQTGVLTPSEFFFGATVTTLTMLVLGGSRSVLGAVIGTIAVSALNETLHGIEEGTSLLGLVSIGEVPGLAGVGLGLVLLLTMIALPKGISGGREAGELGRRPAPTRPRTALRAPKHRMTTDSSSRSGLQASDVSVAFGGVQALRSVDLNLGPEDILGLIGPNGAGKTTLLNVLSGFQRPDRGQVVLDGNLVTKLEPPQLARRGLTRTFQAALPFFQMTTLDNVAVGAMAVGVSPRRARSIAAEVLARVGLAEIAELEGSALPPGQQRLLSIARCLATFPDYLLLDEPAAGLSEAECAQLSETLSEVRAEFGCALLLVEHEMSVVMSLCPRVQVLDDGSTLKLGSAEEVQSDPAVLEAYLGSSFAGPDHA